MWLLRWATDGVKNRMWGQLGWFSGLVCVGSVVGAVAWGAIMQGYVLYFESSEPGLTARQRYAISASADRWFAVFNTLYPAEFLCFIFPKIMMLGRLTTKRLRVSGSAQASVTGEVGGRVLRSIAGIAVLCSVAGMVAFGVAAAYNLQAADVLDRAATACDAMGNDTNSSIALNSEFLVINTNARSAISAQSVLEAVVMTLISTGYFILVPLSVAVFRRAERVGTQALVSVSSRMNAGDHRTEAAVAIVDETVQAAAEQLRRLVIACVVVFVTFPARAAFDLLQAYSFSADPYNPACGTCDACQSNRYLIQTCLIYASEIQPIIVALSSPLSLFVSLWIITGAQMQSFAISLNILRARLGRPSR